MVRMIVGNQNQVGLSLRRTQADAFVKRIHKDNYLLLPSAGRFGGYFKARMAVILDIHNRFESTNVFESTNNPRWF